MISMHRNFPEPHASCKRTHCAGIPVFYHWWIQPPPLNRGPNSFISRSFREKNGLAQPIWELAPRQENPGSATVYGQLLIDRKRPILLWCSSGWCSLHFQLPCSINLCIFQSMAGCLDNFQLPQWECCDVGEKRNAIASIIGGSMASVF